MFKLSKLNLKHDDGHIKKDVERCTGKNEVLCISQKNRTVINAKYVPNTTPIENISFNFQLSGRGDGFTRSLDNSTYAIQKLLHKFSKAKCCYICSSFLHILGASVGKRQISL
jgi:hypothetical protein